ncbi:MAG: hypothetical protein ACYTGH_21525 [Planctomycetota bacterium]|jgi:hypothetical protein
MKAIGKKTRNFFKALHNDESAPGTVEWILIVIVALIVMTAIYFIAQWVLEGGAKEASDVSKNRGEANKLADKFGDDIKYGGQ